MLQRGFWGNWKVMEDKMGSNMETECTDEL